MHGSPPTVGRSCVLQRADAANINIPGRESLGVHSANSRGSASTNRAPRWRLSHRADKAALPLADRHYNRQKVGSPQFVPPGRCVVLLTECQRALWVTSWPFAEYVKHAWAGAWVCSLFRNEGAGRASDLITSAVAATRSIFGEPPALGMVTFISRKHVRPTKVRGSSVWGWTWAQAGFEHCGETKGGLLAMQMLPDSMPDALAPIEPQRVLI